MILLRPLLFNSAILFGVVAGSCCETTAVPIGFGVESKQLAPKKCLAYMPSSRSNTCSQNADLSSISPSNNLNYALALRGGDLSSTLVTLFIATDTIETVAEGILSTKNLATFFAVNGLVLGIGFQLSYDFMMKMLHNYSEKQTPANHAARFAGSHMLGYGILPFLTVVVKGIPVTRAIGWSILPIVVQTLRDAAVSNKSDSYKKGALAVSLVIGTCALALISGTMLPSGVATWIVMALLGSIDVLSIIFPDKMMQVLEYTSDFQPEDYQLRFVTQAVGVHSLCHLIMIYALNKGENPIRAVGYSALLTAILGVLVCIIAPNMRKSGSPVGPMVPFTAMFTYMAWRLLI